MIDQKQSFLRYGISVEFVGEAQDDKEVIRRVLSGSIPLVLVSPENITSNPVFRSTLHQKCIKTEW